MLDQATDVTEEFKKNLLNAQKGDSFEIEFIPGCQLSDLPENPIFRFASVQSGIGNKGHIYTFECRSREGAEEPHILLKFNTKSSKHIVQAVRKMPDPTIEPKPANAPAQANMQENKNDVTQKFRFAQEIGAFGDEFTIELEESHGLEINLPKRGSYRLFDHINTDIGKKYRFNFLPGPNDNKWKKRKKEVDFYFNNGEIKSIVKIEEEEPESLPTTPHDVDTQQGHEFSDLSTQDQRNESSTASGNNKLTDANASDKLKSHLDNYEAGKESENEYVLQLAELLVKLPEGAEIEGNDMRPIPLLKQLFDKYFSAFSRVPLAAQQEFVSNLPDDVQELILAWGKLGESEHKKGLREALASKFAAILKANDPANIKAVEKFLGSHAAERSSDNPLYRILLFEIGALMHNQTTTKEMRSIVMRFDRATLIGLVDSLNNKIVEVEPDVIPPLLDILSESFAQEFYSLREKEQLAKYQELGNALFDLVKMLEKEAQEPYFWRLFSYMREAWGHIAHKIEPGRNESGGARGYLTWLLEKVPEFPDEEMRQLFVISLMIGNVKHEAETEEALVQFLVEHVWQATGSERQARRMRIDNAIPMDTRLHYMFLQSYGNKGQSAP